jgi:carbohydrate-selective porin OprB
MGVGEDFAAFASDYENLTFCGADIGNIIGRYIYNWPISQWATRVKFNLNGLGYFQVGAYDQNQRYLDYPQALLPVFCPGSTGVLMPAELAWLPTFGNGALPVGTTHVNERVAGVEALQNSLSTTGPVAVQHSEYVYELFYTIVPAPGLYIRPDFQVIQYPGGSSLHKNDVVFGLKALAIL